MRRRLGAALIGAALVASGCQPGPPAPTPPAPTASAPTASATPTPTRPTDAIAWQPCLLGECGTLRVPLRHERPDAGSIELAVARVRASASPRLGTLFVNPGGPGIPGRMLARLASEIDGLEQWDVVAWDTRGVGASTALTCLNAAEEETYLTTDFSPDTPAERDALLAQERLLGQACRDRSADGLAASVSTRDSARDLDLLRAAVGESKLTYAGLSAGASLGAAYATLFPARVGRLVLDAGSKALGADRAAWASGFGRLLDHPDARIVQLSEHHAVAELHGQPLPALGETVRVVPNHACNAANLADEFVIVVDGDPVDTWSVAARGMNA